MTQIIKYITYIFRILTGLGFAVIGILLIFPANTYFTYEILKPLIGCLFLSTSSLLFLNKEE
jgi:fucose permease